MTTSYTFTGSIHIDPALNNAQLKEARTVFRENLNSLDMEQMRRMGEDAFDPRDYWPLHPFPQETFRETEEGDLKVRTCANLDPSHASAALNYGMDHQVKLLMDHFPDHTFTGEVSALHPDAHKAVRVVADGQTARHVEGVGRIHWDDGTTTPIQELS